jgi:hypothetical protein
LKIAKPPPGTEELMDDPGANSDRNGATFEVDETVSDFVVFPTLTAVETQAGASIALTKLSFPDAMAAAIPTERRLSMMGLRGLPSQFAKNCPPPRLTLTEAKL